MQVTIRQCMPCDKEAVVALWNKVLYSDKWHNRPDASFDLKMKQGDDLFFVAIDTEIVVGTVTAGFDGHRGWLYSLAVDAAYQEKGIGSMLVSAALDKLKHLGCLKVNIQITGNNRIVIDFYRKLGFKIEDRISMGKILY
jgi:ribosomal protein S18 acetylase RimI-like enzyme